MEFKIITGHPDYLVVLYGDILNSYGREGFI
ncbi:hypothetical protein PhiCrAssBcn14_100 [Bacteroides phage PhiCrAssBcn14]|nr:hypothetical protein PhiCrAssBcn14_100 [Bacteroides phage PhiCrAssBcn14]WCF58552.1 hypothetical protein PhiCrAssBcn15_62 [Bacteroides phage PhiCrAssBcn15]